MKKMGKMGKMGKALAVALGGLMVAGSATPVMAASYIDFSGYYNVYNSIDANLGRRSGAETGDFTDIYMGHRLTFDFTFTPTDEFALFLQMRAPDFSRWGANRDGIGGATLKTKFIYGVIEQNWGTTTIGRIDDDMDMYGLASLGYLPGGSIPAWTLIRPFDGRKYLDALRYTNEWDNGFSFMAQYGRLTDGAAGVIEENNGLLITDRDDWWSNQDWNRYQLEVGYQWDDGGAILGLMYDHDNSQGPGLHTEGVVPGQPILTDSYFGHTSAWYLNPAIIHSFGEFSVHFEGMLGWGTENKGHGLLQPVADLQIVDWKARFGEPIEAQGYAFYLDADYNYGPGNVTLAGWWSTGSDVGDAYTGDVFAPSQGTDKSLVALNQGGFAPMLVANNATASGFGRYASSPFARNDNFNAIMQANNGFANFIRDGYYAPVRTDGTIINPGIPTERLNEFYILGGFQNGVVGSTFTAAGNYALNAVRPNMDTSFGSVAFNAADWGTVTAPAGAGFLGQRQNDIVLAGVGSTATFMGNLGSAHNAGYFGDVNAAAALAAGYETAPGSGVGDPTAYVYAMLPTLKSFQTVGSNRTRTFSFNQGSESNHWALALTGTHALTDAVSMHYGLAYLSLTKPNYRIPVSGTYVLGGTTSTANSTGTFTDITYMEQAQDLGFEIDLGFKVTLLDNLIWTTSFGYMFNGDAYKNLSGYSFDTGNLGQDATAAGNATGGFVSGQSGTITTQWDDPNDTYVWYNTLTFRF